MLAASTGTAVYQVDAVLSGLDEDSRSKKPRVSLPRYWLEAGRSFSGAKEGHHQESRAQPPRSRWPGRRWAGVPRPSRVAPHHA